MFFTGWYHHKEAGAVKIFLKMHALPVGQQFFFRVAIIISITAIGTLTGRADWKLVWSDEFNGESIDTNHWTFEIGNRHGWGNREWEYYTSHPENAYVSNGVLHIVAWQERIKNSDYTSARMKSEGLFAKQYGRFEFRAKFPQGKGFWPALWLMPENNNYGGWPSCGEIDVVENRGNHPDVVQGTIHYAAAANGKHLQSSGLYTFPAGDGVYNFHTYAVEWATNSISWFVDSHLYETQTNWSTDTAPYPAPFNQPFYIIMNMAVGGLYSGYPDTNTVFPGDMQVDYIRVYDKIP
jgi:beta-glucanase (GH16 family)